MTDAEREAERVAAEGRSERIHIHRHRHPQGSRMMDARKVIARALVKRNYPSASEADLAEMGEGFMLDADAALSALKSAGMAIVPVEEVANIITAWAYAHDIDGAARNDLMRRVEAMIAAAKDQTDGR